MNSETLRFLRPRDAQALATIRHRAIQECPRVFGTPPSIELSRSAGYYRCQLLSWSLGKQARWAGLWRGDHLLGVAGLRRKNPESGPHGLIFSMYVVPDARGGGRGGRLLRSARAHLHDKWNLPECRMCVETGNEAALRLYQHCGFRILDLERDAFRILGHSHDIWILTDLPLE